MNKLSYYKALVLWEMVQSQESFVLSRKEAAKAEARELSAQAALFSDSSRFADRQTGVSVEVSSISDWLQVKDAELKHVAHTLQANKPSSSLTSIIETSQSSLRDSKQQTRIQQQHNVRQFLQLVKTTQEYQQQLVQFLHVVQSSKQAQHDFMRLNWLSIKCAEVESEMLWTRYEVSRRLYTPSQLESLYQMEFMLGQRVEEAERLHAQLTRRRRDYEEQGESFAQHATKYRHLRDRITEQQWQLDQLPPPG